MMLRMKSLPESPACVSPLGAKDRRDSVRGNSRKKGTKLTPFRNTANPLALCAPLHERISGVKEGEGVELPPQHKLRIAELRARLKEIE